MIFDFKKLFESPGQYDPYPGHPEPRKSKHLSYRDLVQMVYDRMKDPNNTLPENQVVAAVAKQYAGQFGPYGFTFDHMVGLIKGDRMGNRHGVAKTEDAHDCMPRKTKQIDRARELGMDMADDILDPSINNDDPAQSNLSTMTERYTGIITIRGKHQNNRG